MMTPISRSTPTPASGTQKWREKVPAVMYSPAVSRDASLVASSDFWPGGTLTLQDGATGKATSIPLPDKPQSPIGIAPDNQNVAYVAENKGLTLYSLKYRKNVWQTPYHGNVVLPPAFSPDGSRIAMPGDTGPVVVSAQDGKTVWQQPIGKIITTSEPAFSPDGKTVGIICTADDPDLERTVDVRDAATGKPAYRAVMEEQENGNSPLIVDVHDLATDAIVEKLKVVEDAGKDGSFQLADAATNQVRYKGSVEMQVAHGMLAGMDYKITDAKTGQEKYKAFLRKFEGGQDGPKPARLYLLDANSGKSVAPPTEVGIGYDGMNYWRDYHLAFAPDGQSIAVTRNENATTTISLYDAKSLARRWEGSVEGKTGAPAFSPDGSQIAMSNLVFQQKGPGPALYPTDYAIETFDARTGQLLPEDVIGSSTDRDSVSAPFFSAGQVCAVDVNQTSQEAALVAFPAHP